MNDRLQKAIFNNIDLYKAIFSSQKIKFFEDNRAWFCLEKTPPFYSNLVTLSPKWMPNETFLNIDKNYQVENWKQWSVKDSFGVLDLHKNGFVKLFDAQWIYLDKKNFNQTLAYNLTYEIIKEKKSLAKWRSVWSPDENIGEQIFDSELLSKQNVYFVACYRDKELISGCFLNKQDNVIGISNFFAHNNEINYWSDLINFIYGKFGQIDIVGYEKKDLVGRLHLLGFKSVGNLTVWQKKH